MKLSAYTVALLEDIEGRIDPEAEDDYQAQWQAFWSDRTDAAVFTPIRRRISPPGLALKEIHINDALHDLELMLDFELELLSKKLAKPSAALGVRANYGTGIMTSLFGAPLFEMPRETKTLPTTRSLEDTDEVIRRIEKGIPDLGGGFGGRVLAFGELCAEVFEKYPKIKKYVSIYHPDTQGTLDIAELLWGQEMFYAMYDDEDLVHSVLRGITDTYKAFMDRWYGIVPQRDGLAVHWEIMHKGKILLRLDSAMNISREFYEAFSKPYDRELLDYYGGGCMHFCGRGDHYISSLCEIEGLYGFNLSQPHLNDMSVILGSAREQNKKILELKNAKAYAAEYPGKGGILHAKE